MNRGFRCATCFWFDELGNDEKIDTLGEVDGYCSFNWKQVLFKECCSHWEAIDPDDMRCEECRYLTSVESHNDEGVIHGVRFCLRTDGKDQPGCRHFKPRAEK